ncbi:GntR family transcriptional regulator [Salibacterium aidingense]|uniref:GntR family transcriptional regulator n=1 Tax=Salibacterium aidingense TaxID=384933 RepID=UPI0003F906FE|nr:GntR family transcriptional regulator [Salibacterium aidingense]
MKIEIDKHLPSSRREQVFIRIRDAILTGEIQPGERIREKEIAELFGVSRGPIREAIRQLEQEGLVHSFPYKETVAATFTEEEIHDVFIPIRIILESNAIKRFEKEPIQDEDLQQLQHFVDQMVEAGEHEDLPTLVENNLNFHKYLVTLSGSKSLEQIWNSIINRIRIHFYKLGQQLDTTLKDHALEHQEIINAIEAQDMDRAITLLEKHIK